MKRIYLLAVAVAVSFALLQTVEAGSRGGGRSFGGGHSFGSTPHFSAPSYHSAPSRSYSGGGRYYGGGTHYSSGGARFSSGARYHGRGSYTPGSRSDSTTRFRNPTYSANGRHWTGNGNGRFAGNRNGALAGNHTTAYNSVGRTRNGANVTNGNHSRGFNPNGRNVLARHSANRHPNWNRHHDHNWHGHRCHFHNGFWYVYDPFLWYPYPYGYNYYPYEAYYDSGYDTGAYSDDGTYQETNKDHQYAQDQNVDGSRVSEVQSALAREGYYHGAIDGVLGPGTRLALRNYQRAHGLDATGAINQPLIEALRLR